MPRPNGRDPETDPAAFLGDELRRARVAAGYSSQESLAAELGFDRSVVTKAETGDRPPTPEVLAPWCKVCHLDYEHFARMATLARRADGPVPRWFESWLDAEGRATMLRYWSPIIVPALFNTADYARALLLAAQTDTSDDAIDALVEAKLERQAILDRRDPPEVVALIDEMVLHRLIGSREIMHEQLLHVAELPGARMCPFRSSLPLWARPPDCPETSAWQALTVPLTCCTPTLSRKVTPRNHDHWYARQR